ncbi:MAG: alpha/beta fold hydrolase [Planctomycetota bacterium]
MSRSLLACAALLLTMACPASGQQVVRFAEPDRLDMARAYLRFDRALAASSLENAAEIASLPFDRATTLFFSGRDTSALPILSDLNVQLLQESSKETRRLLESKRIAADPAIIVAGPRRQVTIRLTPIFDPGAVAPVEASVLLLDPNGDVRLRTTVALARGEARALELPRDALDVPGGWTVVLRAGEVEVDAVALHVVREPLDEAVPRLERALAAIEVAETLIDAAAATRDRLALLSPEPTPFLTARLMAQPAGLLQQLERDIALLRRGIDPFRSRPGETWRTLSHAGTRVPMRVYAPAHVLDDTAPLIIALHGAGADEQMWLSGFNDGQLRALADEHGFIVACPSTYALVGGPLVLDRVLDVLDESYQIDRDRVAIIGHSLGGFVASRMAQLRSDRIDAVCCFAGARPFEPDRPTARALIVGAGRDPIIAAGPLRALSEQAQAEGLPVEYRHMETIGHTTVVNAALEESILWILDGWSGGLVE